MSLLKKDLYRYFPLWLCSLLFLWILLLLNRQPEELIAKIEGIYTYVPVLLCCLLFNNSDEIDLIISSPKSSWICVILRGASIYLISLFAVFCTLINESLMFLIFSQKLFYCFLSYAVTSLLLLSIALFLRLIVRNAYASVCMMVFLIGIFRFQHDGYMKGLTSPLYGYFDPFLSAGILATEPIWVFNRIILLMIAMAFFYACVLLLKKDNLFNKI